MILICLQFYFWQNHPISWGLEFCERTEKVRLLKSTPSTSPSLYFLSETPYHQHIGLPGKERNGYSVHELDVAKCGCHLK